VREAAVAVPATADPAEEAVVRAPAVPAEVSQAPDLRAEMGLENPKWVSRLMVLEIIYTNSDLAGLFHSFLV
jgi:hypothetical protein